MVNMVKNLPVIQKAWVGSLGRDDALEEGCPLQCSCLESLMDRGAWWDRKEWDTTEQFSLSLSMHHK